jgi:alpha-beta hydrolase superfamily lysophospholipase
VDDYNVWVVDGVALIEDFTSKEQYKEKPFFVAGHSLGGTISLYISLELQNQALDKWLGSVLIAPAIHQSLCVYSVSALTNYCLAPSWIEIQLLELVLAAGGTKLPLGPGPDPNSFPSRQAFVDYVTDPWTYTKGVTLGFGFTALQMLEHLEPRLSKAKFPFLLLHCRDDPVTPLSGSQQLFKVSETRPEEKSLKVYENCAHGPLSWGEKQKAASDMLAWVQQQMDHKTKSVKK